VSRRSRARLIIMDRPVTTLAARQRGGATDTSNLDRIHFHADLRDEASDGRWGC
jgi:hypothetical protein